MKELQANGIKKEIRAAADRLKIAVPGLLLYMIITPFFMNVPRLLYAICIIVMVYCIYRSGICPCIKIYCTHWIKYGDGKVIIKRARKELVNGRPVGKWKREEEEFLLEDLESCGMSLPVLGEYVEFNPVMRYGISKECFFQLKNGKKLGCEVKYYVPEDLEELFRYIYEGTGIIFQENETSDNGK